MKPANQSKNKYSAVFLLIIAGAFLLVFRSEVQKTRNHFEGTNGEKWDALAEYPFYELYESTSAENELQSRNIANRSFLNSAIDRINAVADKARTFIEVGATTGMKERVRFVTLTRFFDRYFWRYRATTALNGTNSKNAYSVVTEYEGCLYLLIGNGGFDDNITNLVTFASQMETANRGFLFLEIPSNAYGENRIPNYPDYYHDYSREKTDELLSEMKTAGIKVVSLSEKFSSLGMKAKDIYFRTDHHWMPQSALIACDALAEGLNEFFDMAIDTSVYDISQYDITYADRDMFGVLGRKVTSAYVEPERFPILTPKYDTSLEVFHSKNNIHVTGTVSETLFDWNVLESDNKYEDCWEFYGYGNQAYISIHNLNMHDGSRILFLRNSFANGMNPFMGEMAEYVDIIDLNAFNGSLETFIEETNPDVVVVAYTARTAQGSTDGESTSDYFNFD